jgi:formylglycine-generating enzyme required for sulfatase activity
MNERSTFEPQTVHVPEGEFLMGSTAEEISASEAEGDEWDKGSYDREQPQGLVHVAAFQIGRYPVTNLEYRAFVQESSHRRPEHWDRGDYRDRLGDHPVTYVSWHDARAYCEWLSRITGKPYRLPTEAEWEKAARGTDGRAYPWGDQFDTAKCNSGEDDMNYLTPVGRYSPSGDSPYGAAGMAGNVWEWCGTLLGEYPYRHDGREDPDAEGPRVMRGGYFNGDRSHVRCAFRFWDLPDYGYGNRGFRVVISPSSSE